MDEVFARIKRANKNVTDILVLNKDNAIIRSSNEGIGKKMTFESCQSMIQVIEKCRTAFKENDEITFLKLRTKKTEFLVVPDKDYILVALLKATEESNIQ